MSVVFALVLEQEDKRQGGTPPVLLLISYPPVQQQREYNPVTAPRTRGDSIYSQALKPEATH
jgi:hypothetical protein